MSEQVAEGIRWDLSDLYESPEDGRIKSDLKRAELKALVFEKKYKRSMEKLASSKTGRLDLVKLLKEYKQIVTLLTKPLVYAHLYFAEKTSTPDRGAFLQRIRTSITEIKSHILFWETYWNLLRPKTAKALMKSPQLDSDRHYLEYTRNYAPHTLSEPEEKILSAKSDTSNNAFSRLFDETVNNIPFYMQLEGKKVKKTESEILSLSHSPLRDMRRKASESLAEGLKTQSRSLTYIFNMILADHRLNMKLRKFSHPMDTRNLANETDLPMVQNLIFSVKKAYPLVPRFYDLKRKLLGYTEMRDYDRYAPIDSTEERIDFNRCRDIVLSGYYAFSEKVGQIVEQFFTHRWIDAEMREGKQGGGFCCETTPDLHSYTLVNYGGTLRDVMTVAHELGHGLHQHLARKVGILESSASLTMAETASVFGEMLIFEKLLDEETDPQKRLNLLCGKIDDNFATVFRQIVLTDFELTAHETGLKQGELSNEQLCGVWLKSNAEMYGSSIKLTDPYRHGWLYIPHFIHTPFYCYAYAFAQLFVLSLFQKYKEDKEAFIPNYLDMLSLGGSKKPEDISAIAGLNIRDPLFWRSGLKLLESLVKQAEELAKERLAPPSSKFGISSEGQKVGTPK